MHIGGGVDLVTVLDGALDIRLYVNRRRFCSRMYICKTLDAR